MKIIVGGRELISTAILQVTKGDDAWVEFTAGNWNVKLNIVFEDTKDEKTQFFSLQGKDDHAVLTFKNWSSAIPAAVQEPFPLGETDGKKVVFTFSGYTVQDFKRIDISFFWEKANGQ